MSHQGRTAHGGRRSGGNGDNGNRGGLPLVRDGSGSYGNTWVWLV